MWSKLLHPERRREPRYRAAIPATVIFLGAGSRGDPPLAALGQTGDLSANGLALYAPTFPFAGGGLTAEQRALRVELVVLQKISNHTRCCAYAALRATTNWGQNIFCNTTSQRQLINRLLFSAMICAASYSASFAQNCRSSGTPAWNESVRNVVADCASEFPSPNNRLRLKIASDGTMSVEGLTLQLSGPQIEPPAMVSWSPGSDAFFVNDGEGSGMSSTFRLFRMKGTEILEDKAVARAAVSLFRRRARCRSSSSDPNVWGFGWGDSGNKIYLLVQSTVHEPCGSPYQFMSLVVRTSDGRILETLSEKQTKVRFISHLPPSFFRK